MNVKKRMKILLGEATGIPARVERARALVEGKSYPPGTRRKWKNKEVEKQPDGTWKEIAGASASGSDAPPIKLDAKNFTHSYDSGAIVHLRAQHGPYRLGMRVDWTDRANPSFRMEVDGPQGKVEKDGFKTKEAGVEWAAREVGKMQAVPVAAPAPPKPPATTGDEVTGAIKNMKTKTGGRLRNVEVQREGGRTYVTAEPENRQRLDHYGSSEDDAEGWDHDGWYEDYAGPLKREVMAALKDQGFDVARIEVDVGDKGHVHMTIK